MRVWLYYRLSRDEDTNGRTPSEVSAFDVNILITSEQPPIIRPRRVVKIPR